RRQGIYDASIEAIDVHGPAGYKTLHMHLDDYRALKVPQECWDYALSVGTVSVFHTDHSVQVQFYRNTDYGCEAIIRTWRGYTLAEDGTIVKVDGYPTPTKEHILADFEHNFVEIPHLAKFLPSLYAEEGHKPVTAY
ncbi:MAG: hypothetical protein IJH87_04360, partial [Atopobiaceae bacterium]|nr:hypothetical protein [Atopobiaceae bacterium]